MDETVFASFGRISTLQLFLSIMMAQNDEIFLCGRRESFIIIWQNTLWSLGRILFETFYCLPLSSSYKTVQGHWPHVNVCRVYCGGVINMLLVLSITSYFHYNIRGCMCLTGPFQHRWLKGYIYSSCYHHHQIGSIHLSHCYHIFPWLCVWEFCHIIFCYLLHIHSGKTGNLFSLLLFSLWWVQIIGYVLSWRSYSFVCPLHHLIIIIVQTYLKTLNL